jgi:hypothetical protein
MRTVLVVTVLAALLAGCQAAPWDQLSLDQALDRLIDASAEAPQAAGDVWITTRLDVVSTDPGVADVLLWSEAVDYDGTWTRAAEPVAEAVAADEIAAVLEGTDLDGLVARLRYGAEEGGDIAGRVLDEAEALVASDPERAITLAVEVLHGAPPARERARALGVLRDLDTPQLDYAGPVRDLFGREGVAMRVTYPDHPEASVLVFSTSDGALLQQEHPSLTSTVVETRSADHLP